MVPLVVEWQKASFKPSSEPKDAPEPENASATSPPPIAATSGKEIRPGRIAMMKLRDRGMLVGGWWKVRKEWKNLRMHEALVERIRKPPVVRELRRDRIGWDALGCLKPSLTGLGMRLALWVVILYFCGLVMMTGDGLVVSFGFFFFSFFLLFFFSCIFIRLTGHL